MFRGEAKVKTAMADGSDESSIELSPASLQAIIEGVVTKLQGSAGKGGGGSTEETPRAHDGKIMAR